MEKNNIIDITKRLSRIQEDQLMQDGIDALENLDTKTATSILHFLLNYVLKEVEVGLGLVELPEEYEDVELKVFDKVNEVYERAADRCYFCSDKIDPNADEFGPDTKLCMMCRLKLANFTEALGIPAGEVFTVMRPRRVQTSRMRRRDK